MAKANVSEPLDRLIELARTAKPNASEREEQRRSFAYGNAKIENSRVTRNTVDQEADKLNKAR